MLQLHMEELDLIRALTQKPSAILSLHTGITLGKHVQFPSNMVVSDKCQVIKLMDKSDKNSQSFQVEEPTCQLLRMTPPPYSYNLRLDDRNHFFSLRRSFNVHPHEYELIYNHEAIINNVTMELENGKAWNRDSTETCLLL